MELFLFSDLIKKNKIKPDYFIVEKIDELDFPLKHIGFLKKNINHFMYDSFSKLNEQHKNIIKIENDLYNEFNTFYKIQIDIENNQFVIDAHKNKKECFTTRSNKIENLDSNIFDDHFIDEINKLYILISLTIALSLKESLNFITKNRSIYNLNSKFIYDEILGFWTNNFKNDFCYFDSKDLKSDLKFEHKEIEHCIIHFYFNFYKNIIINIDNFSDQKYLVLDSIINDKNNYKWYVIFGNAILEKIENKINNFDESLLQGLLKLKMFDYKKLNKILDGLVN